MMIKRSHLTLVLILIAILSIWGSQTYEACSAQGYNPKKAAKYAKKWAEGHNKKYDKFDSDCTNFVSQCVKAGGIKFRKTKKLKLTAKGWITGHISTKDKDRWYSKRYKYKIKLPVGSLSKKINCYSTSFTVVGDFHKFWEEYALDTIYKPFKKRGKTLRAITKNSRLQKRLKLGDVVQVWTKNVGWHHSIIVTGGKRGNWRVSYHSEECNNELLYKRPFSKSCKYRIIRFK